MNKFVLYCLIALVLFGMYQANCFDKIKNQFTSIMKKEREVQYVRDEEGNVLSTIEQESILERLQKLKFLHSI